MDSTRSRYLITVEELQARLQDPAVRIVDVRWSLGDPNAGRAQYLEGHIPGARYLSWLADLSDPDDPVEGQLAPPDRFAATMSAAGIGDASEVVVYDDGRIFMASRLLWALLEYGHDRVRILDGGWPAWVKTGAAVQLDVPPPPTPGTFTARAPRGLRVSKDDVHEALKSSDVRIVDCRMDATYESAGAHIPGATRLPAPDLFHHSTGRLLTTEELQELVSRAGIDHDDEVVLYCGGGVSACAGFVALQVLGIDHAKVYDGSWSEWGADSLTPKESHVARDGPSG